MINDLNSDIRDTKKQITDSSEMN